MVVGLGGSPPTTPEPGCWPRSARRRARTATRPARAARRRTGAARRRRGGPLGPRRRLAGIELVAASDVDNPLLGLRGATNGFGPQKGADAGAVDGARGRPRAVRDGGRARRPAVRTRRWRSVRRGRRDRVRAARLGAERVPGIASVLAAVGLAQRVAAADLVDHGGGQLRLAEPARQGRGRRRRGRPWSTAGRCWCSPGGSRSTSGSTPRAGCPARTRSSRASRPRPSPAGRVRAAGAAPRRPRRAGRPYLVELTAAAARAARTAGSDL